jgi:glycosyltransferase involved in cell wall biosynthesis
VDGYIAISETVAARVERYYGRESQVVYPPVDTGFFTPSPEPRVAFLAAGRLVGYKRFDVAVDAFTQLGYPLVVAGSGPELSRLRDRAGPTIRFEIQPTRERLRDLYRTARALVFPGVEDFGMVPVEAQACGTPVVAQGLGGATETVVDGTTGVLYGGDSPGALIEGIKSFENLTVDRSAVRSNSERFGADVFDAGFVHAVDSIIRRRG